MENYIVFMHFAPNTKPDAMAIGLKLKSLSPIQPKIIWFEAGGAAFGITTEKIALDIAKACEGIKGLDRIMAVQIGQDWYADPETVEAGWLNSKIGPPKRPWDK